MIAALIPAVAGIIGKLIDKGVEDKDEAAKLKSKLTEQLYTMKHDEFKEAASIVRSESEGSGLKSWWRPITMLTFLFMLVSWWFGFVPVNVTPEMMTHLFDLLQIGIGGYVGGRTVEKITPQVVDAVKSLKKR